MGTSAELERAISRLSRTRSHGEDILDRDIAIDLEKNKAETVPSSSASNSDTLADNDALLVVNWTPTDAQTR
ncbi:hypothetical protein DRE_06407 [Drechslerella stenobrocha 248]|uniref:Uncharacterized protein n=1 Tax=Drechslerella stenobrocha 248 TaxID=1043628 RepID=W7HNP8_9PEZI|nr:hypothetical protein DRE_06407 [Drechslerella stenobrocha 248]